jgi:hypothetical protein
MKKALLAVLAVAAASQLFACVSNNDATVRLSWTILVNGAAGSCASVGATDIRVIATRGGSRTVVDFNCTTTGSGEFDIDEGLYTIEVQLIDSAQNQLNSVDIIMTHDLFAGDVVNLGNFDFSFTLSFRASFRVHMGSAAVTGGNCSPTNPGNGAGVALEEVRIAQGAACLGSFDMTGVIDENNRPFTARSCQQIVCQPNSIVHTVEDLLPGNYQIQILGYKGATSGTPRACYYSLAMPFTITNGDVNLGEIFAPFNPLPADDVFCNATKPEGA